MPDHFRSSRKVWARFLPDEPLPDHDEADILPLVQRYLAPWHAHVTLHPGDIEDMPWGGDPIEILAVDAAKGSAIADYVAATFFPALVPGRSIVVHPGLSDANPTLVARADGDACRPLPAADQEVLN